MKTTIAAAIAALLLPMAAQAQYYGSSPYQPYLYGMQQQRESNELYRQQLQQQNQIQQLQRQQFNSCRGNYSASYGCF